MLMQNLEGQTKNIKVFSEMAYRQLTQRRALSKLFIFALKRMSQSCACSLFFAKTNGKDPCVRVPQSSFLPQSCAKEKRSGVEIGCMFDS